MKFRTLCKDLSLCSSLVAAVLLFLHAPIPAGAYDVDRRELEEAQREIEFVNYVGPHDTVSTQGEITRIGRQLAQQETYFDKYRVIRAADPETREGKDADIFIIEESARVDHIRNVRAMMSGYLQEAYGVSSENGDTLAVFITVYNAVFRGDIEGLQEIYKPVVMENLSADNAGIALNYQDWPGKTRMVIPLRSEETRGEREKVDTGELSEDGVIEEMQKEDDRGVEERKDMVDIREEELEAEREAIEEEEAALEEEREKTEAAGEEAEPGDGAAREDAEEPEEAEPEEAEPEEEVRDDSADDLEEREQELEKRKERLEEEEQEVREERETIAEDENEVIQEEREEEKEAREAQIRNPEVQPFFFLETRESGGDALGQIAMADENTGKILYRSEVNTIRGRAFLKKDGRILVIAGGTGGSQTVRALFLDRETLQVDLEGEQEIHPDSGLWQKDGSYYMVFKDEDDGTWRLGRFSGELEVQRRSQDPVFPLTAGVFENNGFYVQGPEGGILKLDPSTLEQQARIE